MVDLKIFLDLVMPNQSCLDVTKLILSWFLYDIWVKKSQTFYIQYYYTVWYHNYMIQSLNLYQWHWPLWCCGLTYMWPGLSKRDLSAIYKCWDMTVPSFKSVVAHQWKQLCAKLFKPASYLQYYPEYKKPAKGFPPILYRRFTAAWLYQASLTIGGGGGGERARVYFK